MFIYEFFSVVILPSLSNYPIRDWHCFTVDQLLKKGDELYLNALRNGQIPDAATISLNCLPSRIYWPFSSLESRVLNTRCVNSLNDTSHVVMTINEPIAIVGTSTDPLTMVEAKNETNSINSWWLINYKEFFQGRIVCVEHENEVPYVTLHSGFSLDEYFQ